MSARTFIALDLDEIIRSRLADAGRKILAGGAKVRWVDRANLHVTLQFLGEVAEEKLAEVCAAVERVAAHTTPFEFDIRGLLCVPPGGRARMIWGGVQDPVCGASELHDKVDAALEPLGFAPEDRPFRPHVTVARIKHAPDPRCLRSAVAPWVDCDFGMQHADRVTVYTSELMPKGPLYTPAASPKFLR